MSKRTINQLSDLQIRRWIAAGAPIARTDGAGLTFTLSRAGTASWVLRYRFGKRPREITIGNYPDITLAAARKHAGELRAQIDRGIDPGLAKQREKTRAAEAHTVRQLAPAFLTHVLETKSAATHKARKHDLDKTILPRLGSMPISEVSPADVVALILNSKRTWAMNKQLLSSATKFFDFACGRQLIMLNPCAGIRLKALLGPEPTPRRRVMLTDEELRKLLAGIDEIGVENALAFRILLATCVRGIELVRAKWEHVDFDRGTWWVPEESVKTRRGFLVPLTPTVADWFRQLKSLAGDSAWVLPARQASRHAAHGGDIHVGKTTLWAAINRAFKREALDIRRFTPHDTRSTAKGHMRNLGVSREISEIALNHALRGMEAIYDVRDEIPERRAALELWAAFLESCASGKPWNVTPLRAVS